MVQQKNLPRFDENALRVNQATLIILLVAGFVLNEPLLALFVALVLALGTLLGVPGFKPVYRYILKPMNIVKPRIVNGDPEPHRFAQGVGAACTLAGALFLFFGKEYIGGVRLGCHRAGWPQSLHGVLRRVFPLLLD